MECILLSLLQKRKIHSLSGASCIGEDVEEASMAINPTDSSGYNIYSLYNDLYGTNGNTANASGRAAAAKTSSNASSYSSGSLFTSEGRAELQKVVSAMQQAGYTSITFNDIEKYRKQLEADFTEGVRADLEKLGLDPKADFTLVVDAGGSVKVVTDKAEDTALIERYLKNNPDKVTEFKEIQAMSNLKRSVQKVADDPKAFKLSLQAEAIQSFFNVLEGTETDYSSQIANFSSSGETSYYLGLNQSV